MSSQAPIPAFTLRQRLSLAKAGIFSWKTPTYTTAEELLALLFFARQLPGNATAVEIGSYIGASSVMIAKGLKANSKLYCIDTWENDAMTEGNWDSFAVFGKNTKSVENRIIPIRSTSVEAVSKVAEEIDLLFIDGDHSYEGVKADFDGWFGKLKSGGIIVMHDIGWAEGVKRVIKENIEPQLSRSSHLPNMFWGWKK